MNYFLSNKLKWLDDYKSDTVFFSKVNYFINKKIIKLNFINILL